MRACFTTPTPCYWRASSSVSRSAFISSSLRSRSGSRVILAVLEALWLKTGKAALSRPVQVLVEDIRRGVRHGRGVGHRHGLPVRHQLGGVLRSRRPGDRAADGLRSAHRVLPRSRVSRRDVVWHEEGGQAPALLRHADGGDRHHDLRVLDPERQQLDADAHRLRDQRRRAVRPRGRLDADHLQSKLSVSPGAHRDRRVPDHRARGGRGGRVAPAARTRKQRARAQDVFHGHVDGGAGRAGADIRGRSAWPQHARASAGQGHGHGRALPEPLRGRAT